MTEKMPKTKDIMPEYVKTILQKLEYAGHEAYAVGGCVRDVITGVEPGDWDIATSALASEIEALFTKTVPTGVKYGTVTVLEGGRSCEVTTFRKDGDYHDSRRPENVNFVRNVAEDLKRRDFTMNAMALDVRGKITDLYGGREDIDRGIIRCVGIAEERFREDALRILRALRFSSRLGFDIEADTKSAMFREAYRIKELSAERIFSELTGILCGKSFLSVINDYRDIISVFIPETRAMFGCEQNTHHHIYDVWEHTVRAADNIAPDKVLRLTMLFHDIAKPVLLAQNTGAEHPMRGHPELGADMTEKILERLRCDRATLDDVCYLVRNHRFSAPKDAKQMRRFLSKHGEDRVRKLFAVRRADASSHSERAREMLIDELETAEKLFAEELERNDPLTLKELAVSGRDLIDMGIPEGKEIGDTLSKLLEHVLEYPEDNTREKLLKIVKEQ